MNEEFWIDESRFVELPSKEELLKIAFDKEVHGYLQVNAYLIDGVEPAIQTGITYGLMHNPRNPLSLQIAQGTKKGEIHRLLPEVTQTVVEDWPFIEEWYGGVSRRSQGTSGACTRYQTGDVEVVTEGVVCCRRRPRFKFPIRHYRRRNRERINI